MCEGFKKDFAEKCVQTAIRYENESIYLERVKKRRKCRQDCLEDALDILLTLIYLPCQLFRWMGIVLSICLPFIASFLILGWISMICVSTLNVGCTWKNHGKSPNDLDIDNSFTKVALITQHDFMHLLDILEVCQYSRRHDFVILPEFLLPRIKTSFT